MFVVAVVLLYANNEKGRKRTKNYIGNEFEQ